MFRKTLSVCIVVCLGFAMICPASDAAEQVLKFRDVIRKLETLHGKSGTDTDNPDRVTGTSGDQRLDLQEEYYHEVAGKPVEGEGVVINMSYGRRDRVKLNILSPGSTPSKGFNAVVVVHKSDLGPVREGGNVYFKGTIERMKLLRGLSIDIRGTQVRPAGKKK